MSPVGWLPIVAELCAIDPPVWVFGGIAEEALLEGSVIREHGDIDLLVNRNALSRYIERFEAIGYASPQVYFEVVSGQPLVLGAERNGMHWRSASSTRWNPVSPRSCFRPKMDLPGSSCPTTRFITPSPRSTALRFAPSHLLPCITSVRPSSSPACSALPGTRMRRCRPDSGTGSYRMRPRTIFASALSPLDPVEPTPWCDSVRLCRLSRSWVGPTGLYASPPRSRSSTWIINATMPVSLPLAWVTPLGK